MVPMFVRILLGCVLVVTWTIPGLTDEVRPPSGSKSHALILVGLPGDEEHEKLFAATTRVWRDWLTGSLGFAPGDVRILFGRDGRKDLAKGPATRAAIQREVADLKRALRPEDRLWVFFLGHGDHDGERAAFHLPGPDLNADELGKLFDGIRCQEQVFWMTTSASGWFLRPLSTRGRIVITASAKDEDANETEFPHALATVAQLPASRLATDAKGRVSVLALYRQVLRPGASPIRCRQESTHGTLPAGRQRRRRWHRGSGRGPGQGQEAHGRRGPGRQNLFASSHAAK